MKNLINQIYEELKQTGKSLTPQEIKDIRRSYRLTQSGFAGLLGISFGTYKNWEIGHRTPTSPAVALLIVARDYPEVFKKNYFV